MPSDEDCIRYNEHFIRSEVLKQKGLELVDKNLCMANTLSNQDVKDSLHKTLGKDMAIGKLIVKAPAAGKVKREYTSQLKRIQHRLMRTTNFKEGGHEFDTDVEQILLALEDVLEAFPLHTCNIHYRRFSRDPKKPVKQMLFDF